MHGLKGPPVPAKMKTIYLDHQATTPLDPAVRTEMAPFLGPAFANPHAATYRRGIDAARHVERARERVAAAVGAARDEIVFTSGATEAGNLAILGVAGAPRKSARAGIVTQATEHPSVLEPVRALERRGFPVAVTGVRRDGTVDIDALAAAVDRRTLLASVMLVNNETGVVQPIREVAKICRRAGSLLHCDMAQALGRLPVRMKDLGVDFASLSSHKSYGPLGVGALYVRRAVRGKIVPVLHGGGQEGGLRPGTLPLALCVGFGAAAERADRMRAEFAERADEWVRDLLSRLEGGAVPPVVNTRDAPRAPGCLSLAFPGKTADALVAAMPELELGTGSACHARRGGTSHVLRAMRLPAKDAKGTIRLSIGRFTKKQDFRRVAAALGRAAG